MRVLATSLVEYPPLLEILGKPNCNPFCGWVFASSEALLQVDDELILGIVSISSAISKVERYEYGKYVFYRMPSKGLHRIGKHEISFVKGIIKDFNPDIIHLNGTEFSLGLEMISANGKKLPIVASIQGLAFVCSRYNQGYISAWKFLKHYSLRDILKNENQFQRNALMKKRGKLEIETLESINHVIGRTDWDKTHVSLINIGIKYHFCNETLREVFYYADKWNYNRCNKHTIFCSNGSMPLKGVHFLLQALFFVKKIYPDVQLRIAGPDVLSNKLSVKLKLTSYQNYLKSLIRKLSLENDVQFLGFLNQDEMVEEYQRCNVYVLPSCIENSPNSLGEAQLLGVPCISSICGGTPDFIEDGVDGLLYRCEEYEMLADKICFIFGHPDKAARMGKNAIYKAEIRHDALNNAKKMLQIYRDVLKNG